MVNLLTMAQCLAAPVTRRKRRAYYGLRPSRAVNRPHITRLGCRTGRRSRTGGGVGIVCLLRRAEENARQRTSNVAEWAATAERIHCERPLPFPRTGPVVGMDDERVFIRPSERISFRRSAFDVGCSMFSWPLRTSRHDPQTGAVA